MRKRLFAFIKVFVSVALILILLYLMRDKYDQIGKILKGASVPVFGLAVAVYFAAIVLASLRIKLISAAQDIDATFPEMLSLNFIGYFFNNFLPSTIGGDVVKAYYLSSKASGKMPAFTSIFLDRVIGLFTMVFMAFVAVFFAGADTVNNTVKHVIFGIVLAAMAVALFIFNRNFAKKFSGILKIMKPLRDPLKKAYDTLNRYTSHRKLMGQSLAISVMSQSLFFVSVAVLSVSIGHGIPLIEIFLRMPIVGTISLLPSINGLGVREGATVVFFGPLIGKENAFAVSILWLLMLFITSIIGGIIYAASPQFKVKLKKV